MSRKNGETWGTRSWVSAILGDWPAPEMAGPEIGNLEAELRGGGDLGGGVAGDGDEDGEQGSAFGLVLAGDLAGMILDHTVDGAEAEASASADGLGGVEGVEDTLRIAQAGAVVGKLELNIGSVTGSGNFDDAAAGFVESIHGVLEDLDEGLEHAIGVDPDLREIGIDGGADLNFAGRATRLEHLGGASEKDGEVDEDLFARSLLGKAEKIGDQITGAAGLIDDFADEGVLLVGEAFFGPELLGTSHDGGERLVDVVGGAGDEVAEGGKFFPLDELTLQLLLAFVGVAGLS